MLITRVRKPFRAFDYGFNHCSHHFSWKHLGTESTHAHSATPKTEQLTATQGALLQADAGDMTRALQRCKRSRGRWVLTAIRVRDGAGFWRNGTALCKFVSGRRRCS